MSLDATLEDILENININHSKIDIYNNIETESLFKSSHKILNNYILINPFHLVDNISQGDIVRYSKNPNNKLSCGALIMNIIYHIDAKTMKEDKSIIDHITLQSLQNKNDNKYWNINPSHYYLFKYFEPKKKESIEQKINKRKAEIAKKLEQKLIDNMKGKKTISIPISKDAKVNILMSTSINTDQK